MLDMAELYLAGFAHMCGIDIDELTSFVMQRLQCETRLLQQRLQIRTLAREARAALPVDASPELKTRSKYCWLRSRSVAVSVPHGCHFCTTIARRKSWLRPCRSRPASMSAGRFQITFLSEVRYESVSLFHVGAR